jgi:Predicted integral membrane protein
LFFSIFRLYKNSISLNLDDVYFDIPGRCGVGARHPLEAGLTVEKPMSKQINPNADEGEMGIERIVFFSDAVFAIAITILALEIRLPKEIAHVSNAELLNMLLAIWPKYLGYMVGFFEYWKFLGHSPSPIPSYRKI